MSELDQLRQRVEAAEERLGSVLGQGRDYGDQLTELVNSFEKDYRDQQSRMSGYESRLAAVDQENVQLRQMLQHLLAAIEGGSKSGLSETLRGLNQRLGDLVASHPGAVTSPQSLPPQKEVQPHNPAETVQGQMQSVAALEGAEDREPQSDSDQNREDHGSAPKSLIDDALDDSWIQDATYTEPEEELAAAGFSDQDDALSGSHLVNEPNSEVESVAEAPEPQIVSGADAAQEFAPVEDAAEPSPSVLSADEELKVLESLSIMIGTDFDLASDEAEGDTEKAGQPELAQSPESSHGNGAPQGTPSIPSFMIPETNDSEPEPTTKADRGPSAQSVLAEQSAHDSEEVPTAVRDIMDRVSRMARDLAEKQGSTS